MKKKILIGVAFLVVAAALIVAAKLIMDSDGIPADSKEITELKLQYNEDYANEELYNALMQQYIDEGNLIGAIEYTDNLLDANARKAGLNAIYDRNSTSPIVVGNTMANIANGGSVAFSGDTIFYVSRSERNALKKLRGGVSETITKGRISGLNVVGDWIYFVDRDDYGIYKIRTDGNDRTKIGDYMAKELYVIGDRMYFVNWNDDCRVYSTDLDGKKAEKLTEKGTDKLHIYGSRFYTDDSETEAAMFSVPLRGGENITAFTMNAAFIAGHPDATFFRSNEDLYLYKKGTGESAYDVVHESRTAYTNIVGDEVVFVDLDDGESIYIMNVDGTGKRKLSADEASELSVDGDMIYYYNGSDGNKLYRIRKDGTGRECVE